MGLAGARRSKKAVEDGPLIARFGIAVLAGIFVLALSRGSLAADPSGGLETLASTGPASSADVQSAVYRGDGVAAIVNDHVISDFDLRQRIALFVATSGGHPDAKQMKDIREHVLKQMETERIELLEAQKLNITVSSSEVDKAIQNITKENHMTVPQLRKMLNDAGVYMSALRGQIAAQIAWSKTVQARYGGDVHVSQAEVNSELKRMAESANKTRYHVAEIYLPIDTPEQAPKVEKEMTNLKTQLDQGAPFPAVASQFSQSPTAAKGGDMGWVLAGQLNPALDKMLKSMRPGQISKPFRAGSGYYMLALLARQEPEGAKAPPPPPSKYPPGVLPLARVLLPIGPTAPKQLVQNALHAASVIRTHIANCEMLPDLISKVRGAVYTKLGAMPLNQLSHGMRDALATTGPGDTTQPFRDAAGIELIVRCDSAPPKFTAFKMPTRDQIEQQLYQEQISVLARRYMRDLRRDADIETR